MGQVVVITGGSAGIGRAAARAFAAKGYSVGLIARGTERLDAAKAELEAMGARVHAVSADVADAGAVHAAADAMVGALGPITVWVNNAMATVYSPLKDLTADELRRVTEVTYLGAVNGTMAALRRMTSGTIVQVSSVLAWRAMPIQGAYCAAKFALRGFTEALRSELMHDSSPLHVTMVHLPAVNTPQFDWARNKTGRQTNAPGPYQPEVAADAILFAATHKRRDVFVGSSTPATILAARLAPGVLDKVLATKGYTAQLGDAPVPPQRRQPVRAGARRRPGRPGPLRRGSQQQAGHLHQPPGRRGGGRRAAAGRDRHQGAADVAAVRGARHRRPCAGACDGTPQGRPLLKPAVAGGDRLRWVSAHRAGRRQQRPIPPPLPGGRR